MAILIAHGTHGRRGLGVQRLKMFENPPDIVYRVPWQSYTTLSLQGATKKLTFPEQHSTNLLVGGRPVPVLLNTDAL